MECRLKCINYKVKVINFEKFSAKLSPNMTWISSGWDWIINFKVSGVKFRLDFRIKGQIWTEQ